MQTANTKQVRKIVSIYFNNTFTGNSWTDKCAGDETMRRVAFKICGGSTTAQRLEIIRKDLQAMFMLAGFSNTVKVTDSTSKRVGLLAFCRDDSGCYVRIKATKA